MMQKLVNEIVVSMTPGETRVVQHGLREGGRPTAPHDVTPASPSPIRVNWADEESVEFQNLSGNAETASFRVIHYHTIQTVAATEQHLWQGTEASPAPPPPTPTFTRKTIYVRTTGSDTNGQGTAAKPYRTFVRACRDLPNLPYNTAYTIDITGITETLPPDFQIPQVIGSFNFFFDYESQQFSVCPLNIIATPKPANGMSATQARLSAANVASVTFDPVTQLCTVNLVGKTFPAHSLKDKWFLDEGDPARGFRAIMIKDNPTPSTIQIMFAKSYYEFQDESFYFPIFICEPSAELIGSINYDAWAVGLAGLHAKDCSGLSLYGLKITAAPDDVALYLAGNIQPFISLCHINGGLEMDDGYSLQVQGCLFTPTGDYSRFISLNGPYIFHWSILRDVWTFYWGAGLGLNVHNRYEGCGALGGGWPLYEDDQYTDHAGQGYHVYRSCEVVDSIEDAFCFNLPGALDYCLITGAQGDAVQAIRGAGLVKLLQVGGSGNTGYGVRVDNGMQVLVKDDATVVAGASGQIKVGNLAPTTWAAFRVGVRNITDFSGANATGARMSQQ